MIFDRNEQKAVVALLGAGSMGTALCYWCGKKILLGTSARRIGALGEDFPLWYDVET